MKGLKSKVGVQSSHRKVTLSEIEMKDFATCVKATVGNTSYSPISSLSAPTLFTLFRAGEFEILSALGIQLPQVLHAEQEYQIFHALHADEEISYQTSLASVVEKKGKGTDMAFMVFETDFIRTSDSHKVASARSTMVYREATA